MQKLPCKQRSNLARNSKDANCNQWPVPHQIAKRPSPAQKTTPRHWACREEARLVQSVGDMIVDEDWLSWIEFGVDKFSYFSAHGNFQEGWLVCAVVQPEWLDILPDQPVIETPSIVKRHHLIASAVND